MPLPPNLLLEELTQQLADAEIDAAKPAAAMVQNLQRELIELQQQVRQPEPMEPYAHEPEGHQVIEAIEALSNVRDRAEPAPASISVEPPGETLGQYQLLKLLGQGGMGAVYKARHAKLDRIVALKVLPSAKLKDPQAVSRFEREMRAVGKLQHPNIVAAHDAGEIGGTHYLVMELVDGIDLGALVKQRGPLEIADACELIRQAALGLQHAHEHGLVHRDIKPSNLMLTRPQRDQPPTVKILDMGLALLEDAHTEGGEELTSTGQVMGTIDYMAPEQSTDTHTVDIRADIYSLGASLFKLLTGRAPFAGERAERVVKKLMALATQPAPELRTLRPDSPPQLSELVKRLLSKSPEDRPTPPAALAELLAPFAQGADLAALVTGGESGSSAGTGFSFSRTAGTVEPDTPTLIADADGKGDSPPWSPRKVVLGFAGAAAVLLGVIIITITKWEGTSLTLEVPEETTKVTITTPLGSTPEISIIPEAPVSGVHQPPAVAKSASAIPVDLDREVAQKLMSIGGKALVFFRDAAGGQGILHPAEPLPNRPYEIYQLGIPASSEAAELLRDAAGLKGLVTVSFHSTVGGSDVFTALAHLGRVRRIEFPNDRTVTANQLKQLAQMPRLGWLALHRDAVQRNPDVLQEFRNVQVMTITNGNDDDLRLLAPLPNLRTIEILEGTATESGVSQLQAQNPHVRVILRTKEKSSLIGSDPSLIAMQQLNEKGLRFEGSSWPLHSTPKHFFALQELNGASPLCVEHAIVPPSVDLQDQDLALISDLQVFIGWDLRGVSSVTPFLRCLTSSAVTEWISLDTCRLSTADLQLLSAMPWLTWMRIMGTGVSRDQVDSLRKSLPYTKTYSDFGDFLPLADEQPVGSPPPAPLSQLDLDRAAAEWVFSVGGTLFLKTHDGRTLPEVRQPDQLPEGSFTFDTIYLSNCRGITVSGVAQLALASRIRELWFNSSDINDDALAALAPLRNMDVLRLERTRITDDGLRQFCSNPKELTYLYLGNSGVTEQGLADIASQLPKLVALHLPDPPGTPALAAALGQFPQLTFVALNSSSLHPEFVRQLFQAAPKLNGLGLYGDIHHSNLLALQSAPRLQLLAIEASPGKIEAGVLRMLADLKSVTRFHLACVIPDDAMADLVTASQITDILFWYTGGPQPHLEELAKITSLKRVQFAGTPVDESSLARFHAARPDVEIVVNGKTPWPANAADMSASQTRPKSPQMPEPPPLEEWLKGRDLLTVKQDGTAMFTTIQAAFLALRAGGAIEVLDEGPYVESLNITLPKDSGLVSRCRSRIVVSGWTRSNRSDWQGPYEAADGWTLTDADGFRLYGVDVFLDSPQAPPTSVLRGAIKFLEASGVLVENCSFC